MSRATAIGLLCVGVTLIGAMGCGLKGPLYLPDHNGTVVTRPAGTAPGSGGQQPATQQQPPAQTPQTNGTAPPTTSGTTKKDADKDGDGGNRK
jgi:predicted small lipoprotein YifL